MIANFLLHFSLAPMCSYFITMATTDTLSFANNRHLWKTKTINTMKVTHKAKYIFCIVEHRVCSLFCLVGYAKYNEVNKEDTPYLTLMNKLWGVNCENISRKLAAFEQNHTVSYQLGQYQKAIWLQVRLHGNVLKNEKIDDIFPLECELLDVFSWRQMGLCCGTYS